MAPPKKPKLSVKTNNMKQLGMKMISASEYHPEKIFVPYIHGLNKAVVYQVNLTAHVLKTRLRFEQHKQKLKKYPYHPVTLKPIDPKKLKAQEKRIKQLGRLESDITKAMGRMADIEKETETLKKKIMKGGKGEWNAKDYVQHQKEFDAKQKKMDRASSEFTKLATDAENTLKIINSSLFFH